VTVAVRKFKVEVLRTPVLRLQYEVFDPERFAPVTRTVMAALPGLTLTEPTYGPKGGFLYADLRDGAGTLVYAFGNSEQAVYDAVKAALST